MKRISLLLFMLGFAWHTNAQNSNQECINQLDKSKGRPEQIFQFTTCKYPGNSQPELGKVIASFLDYETFSATYGDFGNFNRYKSKWAPADGREVGGSVYDFLNQATTRVPDLRGVFIRGVNDMGVTDAPNTQAQRLNPDTLQPGDFQDDALEKHRHHTTIRYYTGAVHPQNAEAIVNSKTRVNEASNPVLKTTYVGGTETRPKNVTVYYYIRIN